MGKQLVITEKPSVARDIAAAIGGFDEKEEYFENDDYVVTWAVGHLLTLAEPEEYDKSYRSWSIKNLPILPDHFVLVPREGQKKRLKLIEKLGRRAEVEGVVNACDAGREGEMIFRRIVEYTGLDKKPQRRLWLQSMTKNAIREGFQRLRPGSELDNLADAAWCRSVGDWLVGMNATRALTQRLKSRGEKGAWSAGRVQTPTLAMLVAREREILAHDPKTYWELYATFDYHTQNGEEQHWEGRYWDPEARGDDRELRAERIFDRPFVDRLLAGLRQAEVGIASETRKKSKQGPPLPFDLTSLQREANKRFSFSARRTLDAAQRLYEGHKLITYPRTDSRHLPEDYRATIDSTLQVLQTDHEYRDLADKVVAAGPQNLEKILDSSKVRDHFAIIPTDTPAGPLSNDDGRIYNLIVRQFLASMMGPATWSTVERIVEIRFEDLAPRFRTTARSLEIPGFLEALGREASEESDLPALVPGKDQVEGIEVEVDEVREEEKETTPPSRYNEGSLLRMMETAGEFVEDDELAEAMKESGIGTPATRAEIIEGLIRKQYARRVDGRLAPTSKAMRLLDVLERVDVDALASPKLTGEWEHALAEVQTGRLPKQQLFGRLTGYTQHVVESLAGFDHEHLYDGEPSLGTCPECKTGQVQESAWGYPCSNNTDAESKCGFMIWKDRFGRYVDRKLVRKLLEQGRVGPVQGFVDRSGRSMEGSLELMRDEETGKWRLDVQFGSLATDDREEEEVGVLATNPVDPEDEIVETNLRYVSRKVLEGKERRGPVLPKVVCHREVSVDEARAFFSEEGKTPILEGFISKRGRPFKGALFRKETGKHGFEFPPREPRPGKPATGREPRPGKPATGGEPRPGKAGAEKKAAPKKKAAAKKKPAAAKKKPAAKKKAASGKGGSAKKSAGPKGKETGAEV